MKTVEWYMSKGFDEKTARYFSSGRKKAVAVKSNPDYTITITFDNNEQRLFDVKPLIKSHTVFEDLQSIDIFNSVYIDDCNSVAWLKSPSSNGVPEFLNKIDISSDTCYIDSVPIIE